jgi:hypothetical protein
VVSYKLIPEGEIPDQAFLISGTFSYAENERTKTINIAERAVDLTVFDTEELVAQTTSPEVTRNPVEETQTQTQTPVEETYTPDPVQTEPVVTQPDLAYTEPVQTQPEISENNQMDNNQNYMDNLAGVTNIPLPDNGVTYRVQIAAGHNLVGKQYFKKLNIVDEVQVEIHDGWHKYTVGNFMIYRDARDYRMYIWNNTPIHDAFVAAYNSGLRITVQEALMIANQKWYK